jgi:hypothetical protein
MGIAPDTKKHGKRKTEKTTEADGSQLLAQVAGLISPPVRKPKAVLAEVVSYNEDQECGQLQGC